MLTHLSLGPLTVPSYPFLSLIGLWAGMWLSAKKAHHLRIDGNHVYNIGVYSLLGGLLGARFWYALVHWEAYAPAPWQALALTHNAFSIPEGVIIGMVVGLVYARRHKLPLPPLLDALAPGAALTLVIGGIGAFLGSATLGAPTDVPWGVAHFNVIRHPAHLYLSAATLIILAVLWAMRTQAKWPGFTFLLLVELYAAARLLLDPFFEQSPLIGNGLRLVQVGALLVMLVTLAIMAYQDKKFAQAKGYES